VTAHTKDYVLRAKNYTI